MRIQFPTQFPQIETKRLLLREITFADAPAIYAKFSDDAVTRFYDLETFNDFSQAQEYIKRMNVRFALGEAIRWGITLKADSRLVGTCGYNAVEQWNECGIVGYDLVRAHWSQGIMPEALRAIVNFGFIYLGLYRIEALVMLDNSQSIRVLQKLGFQEEGVLRGYGHWKGQHWDLRCFSLLKTDLITEE